MNEVYKFDKMIKSLLEMTCQYRLKDVEQAGPALDRCPRCSRAGPPGSGLPTGTARPRGMASGKGGAVAGAGVSLSA